MELAEEIHWLPTYQSREDLRLPLLSPQELSAHLVNHVNVTYSKMDDELWQHIEFALSQGKLVLCMGAGSIDHWIRERAQSQKNQTA